MHDIEPYYKWREYYISSDDEQSPFYKAKYDEFKFTNKIYNYYIHPQWDNFGSNTLYVKILLADYNAGVALIELIGEWNDILYNDIMYLKRNVIDPLIQNGVSKFTLFCENVLNFHGDDNSYYEEWWDDIKEDDGYIVFINTLLHVQQEMERAQLQYYVNVGDHFCEIDWRRKLPAQLLLEVQHRLNSQTKQLDY